MNSIIKTFAINLLISCAKKLVTTELFNKIQELVNAQFFSPHAGSQKKAAVLVALKTLESVASLNLKNTSNFALNIVIEAAYAVIMKQVGKINQL